MQYTRAREEALATQIRQQVQYDLRSSGKAKGHTKTYFIFVKSNGRENATVDIFQIDSGDQAITAGTKAATLQNCLKSVLVHACSNIPGGTLTPTFQRMGHLALRASGVIPILRKLGIHRAKDTDIPKPLTKLAALHLTNLFILSLDTEESQSAGWEQR